MDLSVIAEKIYERRKNVLDMSQDELAEKMGLGKNGKRTISTWENGKIPKLENINKLADALRCDPEHLLGLDEHPHVATPWIAEQMPLDESVIESLINLKSQCDEHDEFDPVNHDSDMKVLLLSTIIEYILTPIENPPFGQPTPEELLTLSRNHLKQFKIIKQEGGSSVKQSSQKGKDAKQVMDGTEFTIGYRIGRIIGNGLRGWFSKNH